MARRAWEEALGGREEAGAVRVRRGIQELGGRPGLPERLEPAQLQGQAAPGQPRDQAEVAEREAAAGQAARALAAEARAAQVSIRLLAYPTPPELSARSGLSVSPTHCGHAASLLPPMAGVRRATWVLCVACREPPVRPAMSAGLSISVTTECARPSASSELATRCATQRTATMWGTRRMGFVSRIEHVGSWLGLLDFDESRQDGGVSILDGTPIVRHASVMAFWGAVVLAPVHAAAGEAADRDRYEPGVLPVLAGDTDVGVKLGLFGQLARFRENLKPYAWRVQAMGAASVMDGATGMEFPYREVFFKVDLPHAAPGIRLILDASYLRTTNRGYFGLGNASDAEQRWAGLQEGSDAYVAARRYYQYDATTPQARVTAMERLGPAWQLFADVTGRWATIEAYEGSLLARDIAEGPGASQSLNGTDATFEPVVATGVVLDTRDHETATTSGQWHDASVRCVPVAVGTGAYCGANLTLRGYVPLVGERLSIATRVLGDVVSHRAPLLELSRYGGLSGGPSMGGSRGIRGAPQGRLHGRTKVLGNVELRSLLLPFRAGSQRFTLGAAVFADSGRVWTGSFDAEPTFDGDGIGLHWGVGGGPRVRWGDSLLIRFDIAHSPLGSELGTSTALYIDVVQVM